MGVIDFRYGDKYLLNKLALNVPEKGFSLESVRLRPDVDEIVRLGDMACGSWAESPIPEIQKGLEREGLLNEQIRDLASLGLFDQNGVMPFWSLFFDYSYGGLEPKVEYEGPRIDDNVERVKENSRPEVFTSGKRWFGIRLINDYLGKRIEDIRKTVEELLKKDYRVSGLIIRKNPSFYRESIECDGLLSGSRGRIKIIHERNGKELEELVRRFLPFSE